MNYKERLLIEYRGIIEKITRLGEIIDGSVVDKNKKVVELLDEQYSIMCQYENVLYRRILLELGVYDEK